MNEPRKDATQFSAEALHTPPREPKAGSGKAGQLIPSGRIRLRL